MNFEYFNRARNATLALVLATGLTLPTAGIAYAADDDSDDTTTKIKDKLNNLFKDEEESNVPSKSESVYVFSNADGSVKNTVVTNWLKNTKEAASIHDISSLTDIENTEGEETFEAKGESLVWQADGKDIYYQGNTNKKVPVELKVTYWLDGVETSAADMAGKSGHVKIRFDYKNNSYSTEYIDGAARTVYTPFMCITGMILDNDTFKNVKTKHAKSMNDGDRTLVGGYALPGLQEDLDLDADDVDIPSYFEIEADVTDFEMGTTATLVSTSLMDSLNTEEISDDDVSDSLNELGDAMGKLIDGTDKLYKGMKKLDEGGEQLADGTAKLAENTPALAEGVQQLADGSAQLADGLGGAVDGTQQLIAGNQQVDSGLKQLKGDEKSGLTYAANSTDKLRIGSQTIATALDLLRNGGTAPDGRESGGLIAAVNALSDDGQVMNGIDQLQAGAKQLAGGADALESGLGQLQGGSKQLLTGLQALKSGNDQNPGGLEAAYEGLNNMDLSGLEKIEEASKAIADAAAPLQDTVPSQLSTAQQDIETATNSVQTMASSAQAAGESAQGAAGAAQSAGDAAGNAASSAENAAAAASDLAAALDGVDLSGLSEKDQETVKQAFSNATSAASDAAQSSADAASAAAEAAQQAGAAASDAGATATAAGEVGNGAADALTNTGKALQDTATAAQTTGKALQDIQQASGNIDVAAISAGVEQLKTGLGAAVTALGDEATSGTLINGAATIAGGLGNAKDGATSLKDGGTALDSGLDDLKDGLALLRTGNSKQTGLQDAVDSLGDEKTDGTLINGSTQVTNGLSALGSGLGDAVNALGSAQDKNTLLYGTNALDSGLKELKGGLGNASGGATQLADGLSELNDSVPELAAGIKALKEGSEQLSDGIDAATKGTKKLKEGLETFNEEGIQKIIDAYNDNIAGLVDRLKATAVAGQAYDTFTGKSDDMEGSVKFIYETDPIEIDED
ncbi:MAG: hypothetical protein Q4D27_00240 [Coriobacteriia bacterium]|nr:hypothetical protein [Coriobacteriia bacterium]